MKQNQVLQALRSFDFTILRHGLSQSAAPDAGGIERTLAWISRIRDEIIQSVSAIDTDEDVELAVAAGYIELKSRWIAINTQINYQFIKQGAPDAESQQRGFALWSLLAALENLLNPVDIEQITAFLAEPLRGAA